MSEFSENTFVKFNDLLRALSNNSIVRTKNGKINIAGAIITGKEFDKLYLNDIKDLLGKYEDSISPKFAPTKQLYSTLDILSSPVLKSTRVPEAVSSFYKKMKAALVVPENKKVFEDTLTSYVKESDVAPVFMLATMNSELQPKDKSSIYRFLAPSSSEIFEEYGTKYNGSDILYLANAGFIEPEAPINMLICKSLHAQDDNASTYLKPVSYEELLEFYSPEHNPNRIRNLVQNSKITPQFIELHQEMLDNVPSAKRTDYIEDLIHESKTKAKTPGNFSADTFSEEILEYANLQLIPDSALAHNISGEFLRKQYLAKAISISRVFAIYQTSPKYFSAVESILTPNEITTAHSNNELDDNALMYIPQHSRVAYLQQNNTKFSTMMYLFLHCDGFSITELKQLLAENKIYDSLDLYIDAGSSPARIKELYENYLIDYQCIKNLKSAGILTEKDMQKYNLRIGKEKVYQDIESCATLPILGAANIVPFSTTGTFIEKNIGITTSNKFQDTLKILGAPEEPNESSVPRISHIDENKKTCFLDNYRIVPLKDSGLIVLLPYSNTASLYLMTYQEFAFILYNNRLPNNFSENGSIKELKVSEKMPEDILRTAYTFEESKPYLNTLGYSEEMEYNECMNHMLEQYIKIKIKGEN